MVRPERTKFMKPNASEGKKDRGPVTFIQRNISHHTVQITENGLILVKRKYFNPEKFDSLVN